MSPKIVLAAFATLVAASAAEAVTVPDYSFETPVQSSNGYTYNPTVTGVTFNQGSGVQRNGSAWGFANAPDGQQTAFLQSTTSYAGAIVFALSDLVVGQTYQVVFAGSARPGYGIDPITVALNGTQLGNYSITSASWADYVTSTFTATAATANLSFQAASTNVSGADNDVGLDNVRVSAASVPEPATWGMMILGFGAIGVALRGRRRSLAIG